MIRALLIIAFLIGSPRDIANRPVKHVAPKRIDLSALVRKLRAAQTNAVPSKALIAPIVPAVKYWLVFSNSNPTAQTWIVESRQRLNDPWAPLAQGSVNGFQEATNQLWATQAVAFYRVGFKWP